MFLTSLSTIHLPPTSWRHLGKNLKPSCLTFSKHKVGTMKTISHSPNSKHLNTPPAKKFTSCSIKSGTNIHKNCKKHKPN